MTFKYIQIITKPLNTFKHVRIRPVRKIQHTRITRNHRERERERERKNTLVTNMHKIAQINVQIFN